MINYKQDILEYAENIKSGNLPRYTIDEDWNCIKCKKQFKYRPFSCAVICNECLLEGGICK